MAVHRYFLYIIQKWGEIQFLKIKQQNPIDSLNSRHEKAGETIHELEGQAEVIYHYREYTNISSGGKRKTLRDTELKLNEMQRHTPKTRLRMRKNRRKYSFHKNNDLKLKKNVSPLAGKNHVLSRLNKNKSYIKIPQIHQRKKRKS